MVKTEGKDVTPETSGEALPADIADLEDGPFGSWLGGAYDAEWGDFAEVANSGEIHAAEITLALGDLISDNNNEVVLVSDPSLDSVKLVTDSPVSESGLADHHVTAVGQDVSGYHFLSFETGLTLYYGDGVQVVVEHAVI